MFSATRWTIVLGIIATLIAVPRTASAQRRTFGNSFVGANSPVIAGGTLVGLGNGVVSVNEGGQVKTFPVRPTADISIRSEIPFSELPKGGNVLLFGTIIDGSKEIEDWSLEFFPLSKPAGIASERRQGNPERKDEWELQLFCRIISTSPLKLQVLPGNSYALAVYDPESKFYGLGAWRGPTMDGMTLTLSDANRSRRAGDSIPIEFGPNPQYAGKEAQVTVRGSGMPLTADGISIRRSEPFTMPKTPLKKR